MCGHGTIGLGVTLAHLGRIGPGTHAIDTPAGRVQIDLQDANTVTVTNVESRLVARDVTVEVPELGPITGDVAYGGNWFFIVDPSPIPVNPRNLRRLNDVTIAIRAACHSAGIGGEGGQPIDHVILQGSSPDPQVHSRNYVLCPDDEYDRSPCGTGSSARLACLAARGALQPGQRITQESVIGSRYDLSYQPGAQGGVIPQITGQAHIMGETRLIFDPVDPFVAGVPR
jgi:proline racemase/4-hydroxyproline epimerase